MPMTLPRGPATNIIAAITALAFLPVEILGLSGIAAIRAGFIPERVNALASANITLDIPWLPLWITPLSATLVHSGWLHLIFNLMMLLFCGRHVEQLLGAGRTVLIYVVGAYAAAVGQWALTGLLTADEGSVVPMVGASGAISALLGTYAIIYSQRGAKAIGPIPAHVVHIVWLALAWSAIQLMIAVAGGFDAFFGGIAVGAHIGGFIAGLLLARPLLARRFGVRRT